MAATAQMATGQQARGYTLAVTIHFLWLVVAVALRRTNYHQRNAPGKTTPQEATQLVPTGLGRTTAATAYAAATAYGGTDEEEKVSVGQIRCNTIINFWYNT